MSACRGLVQGARQFPSLSETPPTHCVYCGRPFDPGDATEEVRIDSYRLVGEPRDGTDYSTVGLTAPTTTIVRGHRWDLPPGQVIPAAREEPADGE